MSRGQGLAQMLQMPNPSYSKKERMGWIICVISTHSLAMNTKPINNGFPSWTPNEFKTTLRSAFKAQMEGKGPHSVLVMGDTGAGKSFFIKEFCSEMACELGLSDAPERFGQNRNYINLVDIGQRANNRPEGEFNDLLKEDPSTTFAVLVIGPGFIDYGDWIRYFENPSAIGVIVLDFIYGLEYYDESNSFTQNALGLYQKKSIQLFIRKHIWEENRKISDRVLIIGTSIASSKDLPSAAGSDFQIKGFLQNSKGDSGFCKL